MLVHEIHYVKEIVSSKSLVAINFMLVREIQYVRKSYKFSMKFHSQKELHSADKKRKNGVVFNTSLYDTTLR